MGKVGTESGRLKSKKRGVSLGMEGERVRQACWGLGLRVIQRLLKKD